MQCSYERETRTKMEEKFRATYLCPFLQVMQLLPFRGSFRCQPGFLSQTPEVFFINLLSFNHSYFLLVFPLSPVPKLGFPHMYLIIRFSRLHLLFSGKIEVAEVVESYWLLKTLFLAPYYIPLIIWRLFLLTRTNALVRCHVNSCFWWQRIYALLQQSSSCECLLLESKCAMAS